MKTKILGIFICMLLIAVAVSAVSPLKERKSYQILPNNPQTGSRENWTQIQKLVASDGAYGDAFGGDVSVNGNTAIIGADGDDNWRGSAYVFIRTGTTWTQQAKLLASDGAAYDRFGFSVSLFGDTALVGAHSDADHGYYSGSVYVFTRSGATWTQRQKLYAPDAAEGDMFGESVSLDGDTALIGAVGDKNNETRGSVYVFICPNTNWTYQTKLLASDGDGNSMFGASVYLDGDTVLIGDYHGKNNGSDTGAAYVFIRTNTTWTQQAKLLASDGESNDVFGASVALSGDTTLIGAPAYYSSHHKNGVAYVFTRSGTTWTQQAKLLASDGGLGDQFGSMVSLDGKTAFIGAIGDDSYRGSVYVFTHTGTTWTQQQKLFASDGLSGDKFSSDVFIDGNTAFIGAYGDNGNGSVYVFTKTDLTFGIKGGLGVNVEIKNNGTSDATDIPWQIHVEGGILGKINKTVNGTVDIPAGKFVTVKTGMLLGFGAISIIANVTGKEQTAEGTQILIFSMVKK